MRKITIDRAVVEQALEALNASMPHNNDMDEDWPSHIAARRALRAALEQPKSLPSPIWRLVPTTMTNDMAKVDQELRHAVPWIRWEAILAAAPNPQGAKHD